MHEPNLFRQAFALWERRLHLFHQIEGKLEDLQLVLERHQPRESPSAAAS